MSRIRVFVLLVLALSGVLCDVSPKKDSKRTVKQVEWKKPETKTTKEKRDSSDLTAIYTVKQKEESFRPLYRYHYQGAPLTAAPTRYINAATTPQPYYSKPDAVIGIGGGHSIGGSGSDSKGSTSIAASSGGIQYVPSSSYKSEGGIQYAPSAYKPASSSAGGIHYASSAYRGPFIATYQPAAQTGQVKVQPGSIYVPQPPSSAHSPAAVTLPLHYGGFEQQLPPQQHQQNQYTIAFPADYLRHYQQNLPSPFPLHGGHMVRLAYAAAPPLQAALKDQSYKQEAVHYISLPPQTHSAAASASSVPAATPTIITHFIPFYGAGSQLHHQYQQQAHGPIFYGGHHQQAPPTDFAYAAFQPQQQTIQIVPKPQIFGPIQMAAVGAAATVIPYKPIVTAQQQEQQLHQPLHHYHQHHHHPDATSYTRFAQSLSSGSGSGDGGSSPIEIPSSETSSSSAHKLGPLYSSPSSSTSSGSIYAGTTGGGSGKMQYTYASDANPVGPVYTHPGALHYGTHLYHPHAKVVEIGSNRVTAGSAAIAGVAPPAYHPQQQSAASNSHRGGGSSRSLVKFS